MAKAPKKTLAITDLAALEIVPVNVEIEWHDGTVVSIPMKTLPFARHLEIERMVSDPTPPVIGGNKAGMIYDYNDESYRRGRADASQRRVTLKLAESIALPIAGATLDERAEYLTTKLDARIFSSLAAWMNGSFGSKLAVAEARAANFQQNGTDDASDLS